MIPILQGRKPRLREIKRFTQGHTANSMGAGIQAQVFPTLRGFVCAFI